MYLRMVDATTGDEFLRFDFGKEFQQETAIVIGELNIYNGEWKINAISSCFHGGLAAL